VKLLNKENGELIDSTRSVEKEFITNRWHRVSVQLSNGRQTARIYSPHEQKLAEINAKSNFSPGNVANATVEFISETGGTLISPVVGSTLSEKISYRTENHGSISAVVTEDNSRSIQEIDNKVRGASEHGIKARESVKLKFSDQKKARLEIILTKNNLITITTRILWDDY
jgi:hypothetical protein